MHRGGEDGLRRNAMDQIVDGLSEVCRDVLVIGGGTAGPMAALKARLKTVRWALTQIDGFPATRKIGRQNAVENP
jgi:hypothetical protein